MSHIEIVLPFGLPSAQMAKQLVHELEIDALAAMIAHTRTSSRLPDFAPLSRALPHEAWLAYQFGLTEAIVSDNSPPFAAAAMQLRGLAQDKGFWFILHPAHVDVGHDQMVMADRRTLALAAAESLAMFNAAKPCFDEAGRTLLYGDAMTWFIRADDWNDFQTTSPDMACNRNLSHWMPEGKQELQWRKLQNEVQMVWHTHPINAARAERGAKTVNSLWLWGGTYGAMPNFPAILPYTAAFGFSGRMEAYGQFFPENRPEYTVADILSNPPEHGMVFIDQLIAPALAADWNAWLSAYQELEAVWFDPLFEELNNQRIDRITLNLSNDVTLKAFSTDRQSQRKFWIRKSLSELLP